MLQWPLTRAKRIDNLFSLCRIRIKKAVVRSVTNRLHTPTVNFTEVENTPPTFCAYNFDGAEYLWLFGVAVICEKRSICNVYKSVDNWHHTAACKLIYEYVLFRAPPQSKIVAVLAKEKDWVSVVRMCKSQELFRLLVDVLWSMQVSLGKADMSVILMQGNANRTLAVFVIRTITQHHTVLFINYFETSQWCALGFT